MGTYPIKLLRDEQGTPFVPLVSSDSVQTLEGEKLTKLLDDKLSPEDLVAGQYIELNTEEGKTTISVDLPASANTINNLTTETSGQGALDAYQGKVLKDSIPELVDSLDSTDANKALSARQGKILNEKTVPEGGKVGQVLKKSSDSDHELEWGDAADPNAIVGDGSIMSIVELSYAEYKTLEAAGELKEDTEYHIPEMGGDPGSGTGGSGLSEADVQYMIDTSLQDIESVPAGGSAGQVLKKSSNEDHALEWGDAADPNAIVGDGSIMKIVELTYNEYLKLEKNNTLAEDTEYHINDWNENERTYLTPDDIKDIVAQTTEFKNKELRVSTNDATQESNIGAIHPTTGQVYVYANDAHHGLYSTKWSVLLDASDEGIVFNGVADRATADGNGNDIAATYQTKPYDSGWRNIVFENGAKAWDSNFSPARYRRIGDVVYLNGLFTSSTTGGVQFTLPAGFRPTSQYESHIIRHGTVSKVMYINQAGINGMACIQDVTEAKETSLNGICFLTDDAIPE